MTVEASAVVGRGGGTARARAGVPRLPPWVLACAALFACGWGGNQFTPLLTLYRTADGWSATVVDGLLAAYVFGLVPALLAGGRVSDRRGRRPVVAAALVVSIAGSCLISTGRLAELAAGRLLSGVGVGLAMAVGTSWTTELSVQAGTTRSVGARRASLSLTAGFGAGAGVAGALAQWGPAPEALPYLLHASLAAVALVALAFVPADGTRHLIVCPASAASSDPLHPADRRRRLRVLVLPMAPWVFATAALAYAILPQAMARLVGHHALIFATGLTVITLGCGMAVQPLARRMDHPVIPTSMRTAVALVVAGVAVATLAVATGDLLVAVLAAVVLGAAYGIALVAGLLEVQRIATPGELASLTGGFYALTYIGFLLPAVLAYLARWVGQVEELGLLTAVAAACAAVVAGHRPLRRRCVAGPANPPGLGGESSGERERWESPCGHLYDSR